MSGKINSAGSRSGVIDKSEYYIGFFTQNMNSAVDYTVTGVGFEPKFVIFTSVNNDQKGLSWGFDNGTTSSVIYFRGSVGDYKYLASKSIKLLQDDDSNKALHGTITAISNDGFTIDFFSDSSPSSNTTYITYMAFG
tara:strand:- start:1218 stop:1628 length:411 start_codon:yes stop_codon:yes gene_type:complete